MKQRNGFVSNSSSSSFVVVLPDNFNFEDERIKFNEYLEEEGYVNGEEIPFENEEGFKKAVLSNITEYNRPVLFSFYRDRINDELSNGTLASFDTSSDAGEIYFFTKEEVLQTLNKVNQ